MLLRIVKPKALAHLREGIHNITLECYDADDTVIIDTNVLYHILLKNDEEILEHYISNK